MANTRDLRRRIKSVRSTSQLTRAMKMVSAARLRRAQDAMLAARPYSEALRHVLADVARRAHPEFTPLLASRPVKSVDLFVATSDRGLAGAFNANILRAPEQWRAAKAAEGVDVRMILVGRKGADFYRRRPVEILDSLQDVTKTLNYELAQELASRVEKRFVDGATDGVYIAFNEFRSVVSQKVSVMPLLPLTEIAESPAQQEGVDFIYEPAPQQLLDRLLSRYVAFELYHALLESTAAEHAARMTSMDNATRNADEMIAKLTLKMNRIRQASITTEIIEVVSGAEALG